MSIGAEAVEVSRAAPARRIARMRHSTGVLLSRYTILFATLVLFVALSLASDAFLSKDNLLNVLENNASVGIIAVGGTLVIIAGGFDLSVGAVFAIAGLVAARLANAADPTLGLALGALAGMGFGVVNGVLTTTVRINPLIGTLAMGMVIRGLATLWTGGLATSVSDPGFTNLGTGDWLGVPYPILIFLTWALLCGFLLRFTLFGHFAYAAGGNPEAARLSGIRVSLVRTVAFALSGLAAGLAGVIAASSISTGQADAGIGIELTAIAAVVIGGTSIMGGIGAVWRTVVGVVFLALIGNGLNLLTIDPSYQQVITGVVILVAVGLDALTRREEH